MSDRRRLNNIARVIGWENERRRKRARYCEYRQAAGHALCDSSEGPACVCPLPPAEVPHDSDK